jgi:NADH-quinone oxidoreductase subunit N
VLYNVQTEFSAFFIKNGIRFFVLSVFFSLLLLLGIACLYLSKGSIVFDELAYIRSSSNDFLCVFGVSLIFIVLFFKLGVFPFHLWALDVFVVIEGPLFLLYLVLSKIPVLYMFVKFIFCLGYTELVYHVGVWSVFIGVLSLYVENDLNRFMVYSSMVQHGMYLVCLSSSNLFTLSGLVYIYINYVIFSCILYICVYENTRSTFLGAVEGLYQVKVWDSCLIVFCLFSLSGVPITLGFLGKFNLIKGLACDSLNFLVIFVVLVSIASSVYYLNIIRLVVFGNLNLFFVYDSVILTIFKLPLVIIFYCFFRYVIPFLYLLFVVYGIKHVKWPSLFS